MKILIVDDRENERYLLETILKSSGYETDTAVNGSEAMEKLVSRDFSLVISDILMPVMDGFELCRRIRKDEHFNSMGFIFYTATYTGKKDEDFALQLGADRFLKKPCDPDILVETIKEILNTLGNRGKTAVKSRENENETLKLYNERLIIKLEQKMIQTEMEIQSRNRAEESLKVSSERLNLALTSSGTGLWNWNLETGDVWFSSELMAQLGYEEKELEVGYEVMESFLHPGDKERVIKEVESYLEGKIADYNTEFRIRHRDGHYIWIVSRGKTVPADGGRTKRFYGSLVDITDKKLAEGELRASLGELAVIHDNTPVPMIIFNHDLVIVKANRAAAKLFGQGEEQLKGLKCGEGIRCPNSMVNPLGCGASLECRFCEIRKLIENTFKNGESQVDVEITMALDFGDKCSERNLLTSTALLPLENKKQALISIQDITKRRQMEKNNRELELQLYQAQKMESIGQLAGGIAHDFNNLLTVILSYSEMLIKEMDNENPDYEAIEAIYQSAERATDLTRQLLAFSRIQILQASIVDINEIITGFQKMIKRLLGEDLKVTLKLADLPLPVNADIAQIEQVLMNLAVNARDAMPTGGSLIMETQIVDLDTNYTKSKQGVVPGRYVMIAMSDSGGGMEKETQEHIFEPFFTTKESGKGTGLGLATVYGIIKQHSGNIWVYSEPGRGTTFKIYLPLRMDKKADEKQSEEKIREKPVEATILIVEDEAPVQEIVYRILSRQGYKVIKTLNTMDAVEKAREHLLPIELVITDVIMPDMNGMEVFTSIKTIHPEIKVLYMSGYTNEVIARQGILNEGVDLIQKPFTAEGLSAKVAEVLNQK